MSVLTDAERRTEAVKADADTKFDRDPQTPTDNDSTDPLCSPESC
jgi:hypothetical protein